MPSAPRFIRFVVTALVLFILLRAVAMAGFYPPFVRALTAPLFLSFGGDRVARLAAFDRAPGIYDSKLSLGSDARGTPEFVQDVLLDTVRVGYVPTALLAALVLATPMPWRRKSKALLIGLLAVHAFVVVRLAVTALFGFSLAEVDGRRLLPLAPWGTSVLAAAAKILSDDYHLSYIVPILLWVAVTRAQGRYLGGLFA